LYNVKLPVITGIALEINTTLFYVHYLLLNDGRVLNEIMIKEGYAKPYNKVFCEMLPMYQEWGLRAKNELKGLYSITDKF
jgi:micrococcal nuclease